MICNSCNPPFRLAYHKASQTALWETTIFPTEPTTWAIGYSKNLHIYLYICKFCRIQHQEHHNWRYEFSDIRSFVRSGYHPELKKKPSKQLSEHDMSVMKCSKNQLAIAVIQCFASVFNKGAMEKTELYFWRCKSLSRIPTGYILKPVRWARASPTVTENYRVVPNEASSNDDIGKKAEKK